MLSFKEFLKTYLFEAKISHFSHIGLDPNNPEHKDLVDAYNAGVNRDPNVPKNPNQIKTFDQLKSSVAPHFAAIQKKRQEDVENKEAFENKDTELVHHDPETGLKVFKVSSGKGCAAVGGDTKWCVADRKTGQTAFQGYDPKGEHSYVIHTPEKGNLSKIGIIGLKPSRRHTSGVGGNFQDKGNVTVGDSDWEMLRKKYKLDSVKALHGIRGLHNEEEAKTQKEEAKHLIKPHMTDQELSEIESDNPEVHKAIANHPNVSDNTLTMISNRSDDPEIHRAIANHPNAGDQSLDRVAKKSDDPEIHRAIANHHNAKDALNMVAEKSDDPEIHRAIANHPNAGRSLNIVAKKSDDPEIHRAIANHPNAIDRTLDIVAKKSDDPEIHKAILNHPNSHPATLLFLARKYGVYHNGTEKTKKVFNDAIDDRIKNKQTNPYQLESFISRLQRL